MGQDTPREEINESVIIIDFTQSSIVFKLRNIISKGHGFWHLGGCEPCNGFVLDISEDEQCPEVINKVGHLPKLGGKGVVAVSGFLR